MTKNNEFKQIILGIGLALELHITAFLLLFLIGAIASIFIKTYIYWFVWYYGSLTFCFWQFAYTIPLYLSLKRKREFAMIKGVIIITVIAVLMNGTCAIILWPK